MCGNGASPDEAGSCIVIDLLPRGLELTIPGQDQIVRRVCTAYVVKPCSWMKSANAWLTWMP